MAFIQNNPLSRRKSSPCNANGDDKTISEIREEPGSSNAGKYPDSDKFCGPAGGAAKGSYPVEKDGKLDMGRISAAKAYAKNAPDPEGIIACADRYKAQLEKERGSVSRRSSSPVNKVETENPSEVAREMTKPGEMPPSQEKRYKKAVSRRSSSPLNEDPGKTDEDAENRAKTGMTKSEEAEQREAARQAAEWDRIRAAKAKKDKIAQTGAPSRRSSSPVNYSGLAGVNESDWLRYGGDVIDETAQKHEGMSRHGSMKGDQSATHTDYANYKGTDKGYHGHTGASHGDQSATHRDYMGNMGRHHVDPRTKR